MAETPPPYVLPLVLGWSNGDSRESLQLYALDAGQSPRWSQPPDGRTAETALREHAAGTEGDRYLLVRVGSRGTGGATEEELAAAQRALEHALSPARTEQATLPEGTTRGRQVWRDGRWQDQEDRPLAPADPEDQPPVGLTAQQAAWVLRAVADRVDDVPGTELTLPGGRTVWLHTQPAVHDYLQGLATQVQNGEPL